MKTGTVFDIKEFSIYDGDGMRTTVFLKGCPLRCQWCHNPEGLSPQPEIMYSAASCTGCGKCRIKDCGHLQNGRCSACGRCVDKCPNNFRRIAGKVYTSDELVKEIMKNEFFLRDGGVTFSGGEPTMQHAFLFEVLDKLTLNKAIQTCGYCPPEVFEGMLKRADSLFLDLKIIDGEKHKHYTGVDNTLILENLERLKASGLPFIIRIPLIAGVNDGIDNLTATAELLRDAASLKRVEILPYNGAAGGKYAMVHRFYTHNDFRSPDKIDTGPFTERGIPVNVL